MQPQLTPADRPERFGHGASRPLLVAVVSVLWLLTGMGGLAPGTPGIAHAQSSFPSFTPGESHENWMRDLAPVIGQRPLRQVVIPGSHDAATYDGWDSVTRSLAQAQSQGIMSQLNAGSRWFDLRFRYYDWGSGGCSPLCADYWNYHGIAVSGVVRMSDVLAAVVEWSKQHPREIVMLSIDVGAQLPGDQTRLNSICSTTLGSAVTAGLVLQPSMVPQSPPLGTTLFDMTMNEIWALPGQPRIITNWAGCTGGDWSIPDSPLAPLPFATRFADQCSDSQAIIDVLAPSLEARTDDSGSLVWGIYGLFVQGTPEGICDIGSVAGLAHLQGPVLDAIVGWRQQNQHNALANLNVLAGDFVGDKQGDTAWPIVQTAIDLNQLASAPLLTHPSFPQSYGLLVTCLPTSPRETGLRMIAYAIPEGPTSLQAARSSTGQLLLVRNQFPTGDFDVRVNCTTTDGLTSSLTIPESLLSLLPGEGCPYPVGIFIKAQGGAEIDVMAPGCQRRPIPNQATFQRLHATWGPDDVQVLSPADFNNLAQGPNIPDYTTHAHDFMMAMEDIYGAKCSSRNLNIGALLAPTGLNFVDVLAGGCEIRYVPNPTTLQQIEDRYKQTVQPLNQLLIGFFFGSPLDIPDYTTNNAGFEQAMLEIYGVVNTDPAECGRGAICHVELSRVHSKGPRVIATGSIALGPCPPRDNCLEFRGEDEVVVAGSLWGVPRRAVVSVRLAVVNATDLSARTPIVVCGQSNAAGQVSCGGSVPDAFPRLGGDVDVLAKR